MSSHADPRTRLHALRGAGSPALVAFSAAALAAGLGRAVTTAYLPVLLADIRDAPGLIGMVMLVNAVAGFVVPLWVGIWSDRLRARGHGRTMPFIFGGSLVTAGSLLAIALGSTSTYVVLALFGAACYTGLNAITTAHRALVPQSFGPDERAQATGSQEFAMLVGTVAGVTIGGALVEIHGWAPFVFAALAVPLLALPTVVRMRAREDHGTAAPRKQAQPISYYLRIARRPGVRLVLTAQVMWVLGYLALPTFFILYAERVLGLRPSIAAVLLAGAGIVTGLTMLAAGLATERWYRLLLMLGVAFMGGGLIAMAPASEAAFAAPGIVIAGVGFGIVSTVGFPLLTTFVPEGEEGGYTALYFSVRSISAAIAVPVAGWLIAFSDSYRALPLLGGLVTLLALFPLAWLRPLHRPHVSWRLVDGVRPGRHAAGLVARILGAAAIVVGISIGLGVAIQQTSVARLDEAVARRIVGILDGPAWLVTMLDGAALVNYLVLGSVAVVLAVVLRRSPVAAISLVAASGLLAWGITRAIWATWDRARPEEVLGSSTVRVWADVPSFPSGHVAVTVAMVAALALLYPRLRMLFWAYAAAIIVTRFLFGAHFPTDVAIGAAIGYVSFVLVYIFLVEIGMHLRPRRRGASDGMTPAASEAPAGGAAGGHADGKGMRSDT